MQHKYNDPIKPYDYQHKYSDPIKLYNYRVPGVLCNTLKQDIDSMLECGIIEELPAGECIHT